MVYKFSSVLESPLSLSSSGGLGSFLPRHLADSRLIPHLFCITLAALRFPVVQYLHCKQIVSSVMLELIWEGEGWLAVMDAAMGLTSPASMLPVSQDTAAS